MKNFNPSIIFFDIDDTLSRNGVMAEHNKTTLKALAKTDIKVVIATGRAKPILPEDVLQLHDAGVIDAIICMNGQYAYHKLADDGSDERIKFAKADAESTAESTSETQPKAEVTGKFQEASQETSQQSTKEKLISHYPLNDEQIDAIVSLCQTEQVVYKFESTTQIGWSDNSPKHELIRQLIDENHHFIIDPDFHQHNDVYQCSVFFDNEEEKLQHIDFAKHDLKLVHWHAIGADILPIEASKARAISDVCQYFAVSPKQCMAFGDGMNDLEMFDLVGCAVAMGDANDSLKQHADLVSGTIEERGIQTALSQLGVL